MFEGLDDYMIPCTNKKIFGIDCLGCGIQRATVLILRGEFSEAFFMYPAIYTLLLLLAFIVFNFFVKFKYDFKLKIGLLFLNVLIIIVSYFVKMGKFL